MNQCTFAEAFDLQMGKTPSRDDARFWDGNNIWVSIADMKDRKYINSSKEGISDWAVRSTGVRLVPKGTVIMSFKLTIGKVCIADEDLYTNEAIMQFPIKSGYDILPEYLYYYLLGHKWECTNNAVMGATLNKKKLSEEVIIYPSIAEQRRIVDELDLLSGIIEKKNAQLRTLDELASTIFYEMFGDLITNERGWETANLSTLVTDKKAVKRAARHFLPNDVIHYIDIASIDNISHRMTSTTEVTFCEAPSRAQQIVENGDVLVSMVRPNLRNVASVCSGDNNLVASSGFCVLRSTSFNGEFVRQLVLSDFFTDYLLTRVSGANYPAVREEDIRECIIGIPPIEMQQAFSEKMRSIEKQRLLIYASLNTVKNLLASRMDKYFNE